MNQKRNIDTLIKRVREELRAEGSDGAGYSSFIVIDALNSALDDLSEIFTIRDVVEFTTEADKNTYDLTDITGFAGIIYDIIRVEYDGNLTHGAVIDEYLDKHINDEGPVREWFLWGTALTLIGEIEAEKEVKLWVNRAPKHLPYDGKESTPETPRYADEALIAFAISVCYRESKEYERANYHHGIYREIKQNLTRRAIPQGQKDALPIMQDSYAGPFRSPRGFTWTDKNPRGRWHD